MENSVAIRTKEEGMIQANVSREVASVQAAMIVAKNFRRDTVAALDRIKTACQRNGLAQSAIYSYSRGGSEITGPSIRLAEAIAQNWGNMNFGIVELENKNGESIVEAFAWDLETNTKQSKIFTVKHKRTSKAKGTYDLTDPRDIYEMVANQGARRLRSCILSVIPSDIVDEAVQQCEQTLKTNVKVTPESIQSMVEKFGAFGVSREQLEARIQRRIDSITPAQVVSLGKIYNSLKDGMSSPIDWFEPVKVAGELEEVKTGNEGLKSKLKAKPEPTQARTEQFFTEEELEEEAQALTKASDAKPKKKSHTVSDDTIACPLEDLMVISTEACKVCDKKETCPELNG